MPIKGRPTKYKEEYCERVADYLSECIDTIEDYHKTRGEKSDTYDRIVNVKLPTVEGFARYIGVNKTTLYEWEKTHPIFSNALDDIRQEQQQRLIEGGLSGSYNATIAKLVLSNNHGMREKHDTDITTGGEKIPVLVKFIDANDSDSRDSGGV